MMMQYWLAQSFVNRREEGDARHFETTGGNREVDGEWWSYRDDGDGWLIRGGGGRGDGWGQTTS